MNAPPPPRPAAGVDAPAAPRRRGSSLRRRISLAVVGTTSLVVLVAALGIWLAARAVFLRGIDRDLAGRVERTRRFESMPQWRGRPPGSAEWWRGEGRPERGDVRNDARNDARTDSRGERGDSRRLLQIVDIADDRELMRSPSLPEGVRLGQPGDADLGAARTRTLPDGRRVRVLAMRLTRPAGGDAAASAAVAYHAVDLEQIDAELARMGGMLLALWGAATLLAWGAVIVLRAAILRPMRELDAAIARLGPDDLAVRVSDTAGPDEVRGIVDRLNGLLDRLEAAFRREQATIASIAHELRTPVAALRTTIEFRLLAVGGGDEAQVLRACLATVERMQAMVANLLLLARLEAGREPLQREEVDLAQLLSEAAEPWEARAAARSQRLRLDLPAAATVESSALHLRLIVDNLVGNAVAHGAAGDVALGVAVDGAGLRMTVENAFSGTLDPEQLGKAFYRGDAARSGSDHCGLGLALCRRLAALLGGALSLEARDGRFRATLALPLRAASVRAAWPGGDREMTDG